MAKKKRSVKQLKKKAIAVAKNEMEKAKKKFIEVEKRVKAYAVKNPEKAILIAGAVGAAIGAGAALALRRLRKK